MARFDYSGLTSDGQRVSGTRRARTLGDARRATAAEGLHAVQFTQRTRVWNTAITAESITRGRRQQLLRQLAVFVRSGIPILDALQVLADESDDRLVRGTVLAVVDDVRAGSSLAAALADRPELLQPHHVAVIRAAEATGRLADALDDIDTDLTRDLEMRVAVRGALTYPAVVVALAAVTVTVLAVIVLPRFERLFDDLDADPPLVTRVLLGAARWPTSVPVGGWFVLLLAFAAVALVSRRPRWSRARALIALRLPAVGALVRLTALERFCRVVGATVRSGVPLPTGVLSAGEAIGNAVLKNRVRIAHDRILSGQGLTRSLADLDVLTPAVRQMIAVGESTGTLAEQCGLAADHLHGDINRRITRATAVLEPVLIVGVGVVVGFVAVALISAMYGLIDDLGTQLP